MNVNATAMTGSKIKITVHALPPLKVASRSEINEELIELMKKFCFHMDKEVKKLTTLL